MKYLVICAAFLASSIAHAEITGFKHINFDTTTIQDLELKDYVCKEYISPPNNIYSQKVEFGSICELNSFDIFQLKIQRCTAANIALGKSEYSGCTFFIEPLDTVFDFPIKVIRVYFNGDGKILSIDFSVDINKDIPSAKQVIESTFPKQSCFKWSATMVGMSAVCFKNGNRISYNNSIVIFHSTHEPTYRPILKVKGSTDY